VAPFESYEGIIMNIKYLFFCASVLTNFNFNVVAADRPNTPLQEAILSKSLPAVQEALTDITLKQLNATNHNEETAMHHATLWKDDTAIVLLFNAYEMAGKKEGLDTAAINAEIAKVLLAQSISRYSPLHRAAGAYFYRPSNYIAVKTLISKAVEVLTPEQLQQFLTAHNNNNDHAMHVAVYWGKTDNLSDSNSVWDEERFNRYGMASAKTIEAICLILKEKFPAIFPATLNEKNNYSATALSTAARENNLKAAETLLKLGADKNEVDGTIHRRTPLQIAQWLDLNKMAALLSDS